MQNIQSEIEKYELCAVLKAKAMESDAERSKFLSIPHH